MQRQRRRGRQRGWALQQATTGTVKDGVDRRGIDVIAGWNGSALAGETEDTRQRAVNGRSGKVKEDVDRRGIDVIAAISRACEMRPRSD